MVFRRTAERGLLFIDGKVRNVREGRGGNRGPEHIKKRKKNGPDPWRRGKGALNV